VTASLVALTAIITSAAAAALTPWLQTLTGSRSRWLSRVVHVPLAGVLAAGAAALAMHEVELAAFAVLALACASLVLCDLAVYRLPDRIVGPMYPILFVGLVIAAAVLGDWSRLGRASLAALVMAISYFALAWLSPSGLSLGDVKFSGLLGAFLGWLGWPHVLLGTLAGFALGAVVSLSLLATRLAGRKSDYPFGPWMVAGAAVGAVWGPALWS
jgi:leader peptidase (prepilin peptidase)/N-methyltransferase